MDQVFLSVTMGTGTVGGLRFTLNFPKQYKSVVGEWVRPEGTFETGLVLHCQQPRGRRGETYAVRDDSGANFLTVDMPAAMYGKVGSTKHRTLVLCEAEIVDGRSVIVFDRVEPAKFVDRAPRKMTGRKPRPAVEETGDAMADIKAGMAVLKARVHDEALARAIIAVANSAHRVHADLQWNGVQLVARIIQSL